MIPKKSKVINIFKAKKLLFSVLLDRPLEFKKRASDILVDNSFEGEREIFLYTKTSLDLMDFL